MRNPFKKNPPETRMVNIKYEMPFKHDVTVSHKYEPKPQPQQMTIMIRDMNGHEYRLMPINLNGQTEARVDFPLAFITGNPGDVPVPMFIRMYYNGY